MKSSRLMNVIAKVSDTDLQGFLSFGSHYTVDGKFLILGFRSNVRLFL